MPSEAITNIPIIEEHEATGEIAQIYNDIKREMEVPFVPNIVKAVAISPAGLKMMWDFLHSFYSNVTLPQSLVSMIAYTIAQKNHCEYCSANNELTCRTLGIDEKTLAALVEDLGSVSPARIAAIIDFAVKVAKNPQGLSTEDYDLVREQGISEAEIIEIIFIAAFGYMNDIVAESLKVDVDAMTAEALGR
jgi:uncharacterized peroxidase-related enzyme